MIGLYASGDEIFLYDLVYCIINGLIVAYLAILVHIDLAKIHNKEAPPILGYPI